MRTNVRDVSLPLLVLFLAVAVLPIAARAAVCSSSPVACTPPQSSYYAPAGSSLCQGGSGGYYCAAPTTQATRAVTAKAALVSAPKLPVLALGSKGTAVTNLQNQLISLGYLSADSATGYFGALTRSAVIRFQRDRGLEAVGYIGPKTQTALRDAGTGTYGSGTGVVSGDTNPAASATSEQTVLQTLLAQLASLQAKLASLTGASAPATAGSSTAGSATTGAAPASSGAASSGSTPQASTANGSSSTSGVSASVASATVDYKINNSDGPVSVTEQESVSDSWSTTGVSNCVISATGVQTGSWAWTTTGSRASVGPYTIPGTITVTLTCKGASGVDVKDSVILVVKPAGSDAERRKDIAELAQALERYYDDHGSYRVLGSGYDKSGQGWALYEDAVHYQKSPARALYEAGYLSRLIPPPAQGDGNYMIYPCNDDQRFSISATLTDASQAERDAVGQSCYGANALSLGKNYVLNGGTAVHLRKPLYISVVWENLPGAKQFRQEGMEKVYLPDVTGDLAGDERSIREINYPSLSPKVAATKENPYPVIIIDLETPSKPYDIRYSSRATVDATIAYVGHLIDVAREAHPGSKIGMYGIPIIPRNQNVQEYAAWDAANMYLAPIAQKLDFISPSLYATVDPVNVRETWIEDASLEITAARKFGKPVIPFMSPSLYNTNGQITFLPVAQWDEYMRYLLNNTEGVVVWDYGGFHGGAWDELAPWWTDLKDIARDFRQ